MAKLPDGHVFIYKPKRIEIEIEEKELVVCKHCKHYKYYGLQSETVSECELMHTWNPAEDWWCADGERKEE